MDKGKKEIKEERKTDFAGRDIHFRMSGCAHPFEDYFIPHWMNFSYYQMSRRSAISIKFKPRINLPDELLKVFFSFKN